MTDAVQTTAPDSDAKPKQARRKQSPHVVQVEPLYLARPDAATYLSISESMLDKLVAQKDVPPPRKISAGRSAWLLDELKSWGRNRPVSDLLPPPSSGYGRAGKSP